MVDEFRNPERAMISATLDGRNIPPSVAANAALDKLLETLDTNKTSINSLARGNRSLY